MYLIDTNVVSEARKKAKANPGVVDFFQHVIAANAPVYLSAISVGELRRGVELCRHRGYADQAKVLEAWLTTVLEQFGENILSFDGDVAQAWGRLRVPVNDLTVVTRNTADFAGTGVRVVNPFRAVPDLAEDAPVRASPRVGRD